MRCVHHKSHFPFVFRLGGVIHIFSAFMSESFSLTEELREGQIYSILVTESRSFQDITTLRGGVITVPGMSTYSLALGARTDLPEHVLLYTDGEDDYRVLTLEELPVYVGKGWVSWK